MTPHVEEWIGFLATVEVSGPIPVTFRVYQAIDGMWILQSTMDVPDRDRADPCDGCGAPRRDTPIIIQQALPVAEDRTPKAEIVRQRVLGHYQHEALESIFVGGERAFDPHHEHWYSNLVADWRFNR